MLSLTSFAGGYAIMQLGTVAMKTFSKTETLTSNAGEILYVVGALVALVMWGFGLVWLFFALASIARSKFPFNIGWWGFTFPLGVYTLATNQLGKEIPSKFFSVLGTVRNHLWSGNVNFAKADLSAIRYSQSQLLYFGLL